MQLKDADRGEAGSVKGPQLEIIKDKSGIDRQRPILFRVSELVPVVSPKLCVCLRS